MPLEHNVGQITSVAYGPYRLSDEGGDFVMAASRVKVTVPPTLEGNFESELVGSKSVELSFNLTRIGLQYQMLAELEAKSEYPILKWARGAPGSIVEMVEEVAVAAAANTVSPDELETRDLGFSGGTSYRAFMGTLFDHAMANPAGVSAPTDGSGVNLGAVAADETLTVYFASLHSPAANAVGAVAQLESDTADLFAGAEVVEHVFATIDDVANKETFELVKIPGPITNPWFRLSITAITSGTFYPVCVALIHKT